VSRVRSSRRTGTPPLLSVVVPAYDVEDYLPDTLDSVLSQDHPALEVIVVDDGSPDRCGDIADEYAARDPRVHVLHQANAGLGAARNAGVALASGSYLAFADSDDLVAPGAYRTMIAALEASGSEIAVGCAERFDGERTFVTPLMRDNHARAQRRVRVDDAPLLLADVFAWNKVFRRSFWDTQGLAFPVDLRYEDQPAMTRALVAARCDVLTDVVYRWRVRTDGTAISQQRASRADLADRVTTKRMSTDAVLAHTGPATQRTWFARVLPIDMWEYFRAAPTASEDYWALLREAMAEFWGEHTVPFEETGLPLRQRLMGWLVTQDRRADLAALVAYLDEHAQPLTTHPFVDEPGLPDALRPRGRQYA
jgi:glycosyltransferase involved in cell wall biosynthesis